MMTTEPSAEALPCPFCGSAAEIKELSEADWIVECTNRMCGVSTPIRIALKEDVRPLLLEVWNRRVERDAAYLRGIEDGGEWRGKLAEQCGRTLRAVKALRGLFDPSQDISEAHAQVRRVLKAEDALAPPQEGFMKRITLYSDNGETVAQEIVRLQREIAERQTRLAQLVLGDPREGVHVRPQEGS